MKENQVAEICFSPADRQSTDFIRSETRYRSEGRRGSDTRCTSDYQCGSELACKNNRCKNPCDTKICATDAECTTNNHVATCTCKEGFTGSPLIECSRIQRCTYNPDCPAELSCREGKCVDACATHGCKNRRTCRVISHVPFCEDE